MWCSPPNSKRDAHVGSSRCSLGTFCGTLLAVMVKGSGLIHFRKQLLGWFAEFQRDLPWRHTKDPYSIWLSEIMLQQTRVAAAIPYYDRFVKAFPDVESLAHAEEEEVLRNWAGLGYYSRARNLQKAARQIVTRHHGKFPERAEEARGLSGVGPYTAAAILSIAYGKKMAVLDGNVARVIARVDAVRGDLRGSAQWSNLQGRANELLAQRAPGAWNQAMMELGATVCTPKSPQCLICPVAEFCEARKQGLTGAIPEKRSKRAAVEIRLAALVLVDAAGRTLLLPPPKLSEGSLVGQEVATLLSRMWHFPTIPVRRNAEHELVEFAREASLLPKKCAVALKATRKVKHAVTYRQITVQPFRMELEELPQVAGVMALPLGDLSAVPVSNLTRKVAHAALAKKVTGKPAGARAATLSF